MKLNTKYYFFFKGKFIDNLSQTFKNEKCHETYDQSYICQTDVIYER